MRTGNLLIVAGGSEDHFTRWRDLLCSDPAILEAYNALKRRYEGRDMSMYRRAKADFIETHLDERR